MVWPMTTPHEHWLTRRQAADRAGCGIRTVDRWLAAGLLARYTTPTGHVRIDPAQLDALRTPTPADARTA